MNTPLNTPNGTIVKIVSFLLSQRRKQHRYAAVRLIIWYIMKSTGKFLCFDNIDKRMWINGANQRN